MNTVEEIYEKNSRRERVSVNSRIRETISLKSSILGRNSSGKLGLIAEYKRQSPSGFAAVNLGSVSEYFSGVIKDVASGFSVLTEPSRFSGSWNDLTEAQKFNVPLLAKDFFRSENMIHDAYLSGADAVLLIADFLKEGEIASLTEKASELGMDVLVEFHDAENAVKIVPGDNVLIGYNRRNLRTMTMEGNQKAALDAVNGTRAPVILESGIDASNSDFLDFSGYHGLLIGSSILCGESVIDKLLRRGII